MNTQLVVSTARALQEDVARFLATDFSDDEGRVDYEYRDITAENLSAVILSFLEEVENPTLPSVQALAEALPRLNTYSLEEAQAALMSNNVQAA